MRKPVKKTAAKKTAAKKTAAKKTAAKKTAAKKTAAKKTAAKKTARQPKKLSARLQASINREVSRTFALFAADDSVSPVALAQALKRAASFAARRTSLTDEQLQSAIVLAVRAFRAAPPRAETPG